MMRAANNNGVQQAEVERRSVKGYLMRVARGGSGGGREEQGTQRRAPLALFALGNGCRGYQERRRAEGRTAGKLGRYGEAIIR
jgi:hypothetical protein